MSTGAGTIRTTARPAGFTVWTAAVTAFALAALIMSAVALNVANDRTATGEANVAVQEAAVPQASSWDAGKLDAMEARMAAQGALAGGTIPEWDAGKLDAMEARTEAVERQLLSGQLGNG